MEVARLTIDDIRVHNTSDDCWIAVDAKVWDITDFLGEHPGGSASESRHTYVITTFLQFTDENKFF